MLGKIEDGRRRGQQRMRRLVGITVQMFKLVLEKAEEPEIKLPTSVGSWKKQESSRKSTVLKCVLVALSCPTLCVPMDCIFPGSSIHGILQARILEWVAIPFSRIPI